MVFNNKKFQLVIMAAGKSTRTYPLTLTKPKPLLKILNRTIIERNVVSFKPYISEVILIVGYKYELVMSFFGDSIFGVPVRYVVQDDVLGTGSAANLVSDYIHDRFFLINGDDLFSGVDVSNMLKYKYAVLANTVDDPTPYGVFVVDGNNKVIDLEEKPKNPKSNLINTGCYLLNKSIFDYLDKLKRSKRGEYELTDAILSLAKENDLYVVPVSKSGYWLPTSYPWNLLDSTEYLMKHIKRDISESAIIDKSVIIKGEVIIEAGSKILAGVCIYGPVVIGKNCVVGPYSVIKSGTVLSNDCVIGSFTEIENSILGDGVSIYNGCYIGDSVVGDNVDVGAGTVVANRRHDCCVVRCSVKDEMKSTGRVRFGAVISDGAKLGVNTVIYPGRFIYPGKFTKPGEIIRHNRI